VLECKIEEYPEYVRRLQMNLALSILSVSIVRQAADDREALNDAAKEALYHMILVIKCMCIGLPII
jgi:hypothetical protein